VEIEILLAADISPQLLNVHNATTQKPAILTAHRRRELNANMRYVVRNTMAPRNPPSSKAPHFEEELKSPPLKWSTSVIEVGGNIVSQC